MFNEFFDQAVLDAAAAIARLWRLLLGQGGS